MESTSTPDVLEIAAKAFQLGPFLFAVLFNLVITVWAHRIYREASTRSNPSASEKELNTYRLYFWLVVGFGIILVIVSIIWWFKAQPEVYIYKGVIQNLKPHERIVSGSLYFKTVVKKVPFEDDLQLRDEQFVAIQEKPFKENDEFEILYGKGQNVSERTSNEFRIKFIPNTEPSYRIEWDPIKKITKITQPNLPIESKEDTRSQRGLIMLGSAFAFSPDAFMPAQRNEIVLASQLKAQTIENAFEVLRQERSDVARKIAAIEQLGADSSVKEFLGQSPADMLVLLDLTRHTDRELAYEATKVAEEVGINVLLAAALRSSDTRKRETAKVILFRIERGRAEQIVEEVRRHKDVDSRELSRLLEEIKSGKKERILIPTASQQGDRYYVKAEWASDNEGIINCLTSLFNKALMATRTLDQEKQKMSGRSTRFVYWYSKSWALGIADEIEKCGGKATFVGLDPS
jgi:hypothetical protein